MQRKESVQLDDVVVSPVSIVEPHGTTSKDVEEQHARLDEHLKVITAEKRFRRKAAIAPIAIALYIVAYTLSISLTYLSAMWDPLSHVNRMTVAIVDADTPVALSSTQTLSLGASLVSQLEATNLFEFVDVPVSSMPSLQDARDAVRNGDYWSVLYVPSNLTQTFAHRFYGLDSTANASDAYSNPIYYVYDHAKQYTTAVAVEAKIGVVFEALRQGVLKQMFTGTLGTASSRAPPAIWVKPFAYTGVNLHPITKMGVYMGSYMAMVFTWIPGFMGVSLVMRIYHLRMSKLPVSKLAIIAGRLFTVALSSLACAGVTVGLLVWLGFPSVHGMGRIWGVIALASMAFQFGIAMPTISLFGNLGRTITVVLLYLQLVSCTGIVSEELLSRSYRNATPVLPLWHAVGLMRYLAFDTLPRRIGMHLGALLGWAIGGAIISGAVMWSGVGDPNMRKPRPKRGQRSVK